MMMFGKYIYITALDTHTKNKCQRSISYLLHETFAAWKFRSSSKITNFAAF